MDSTQAFRISFHSGCGVETLPNYGNVVVMPANVWGANRADAYEVGFRVMDAFDTCLISKD